MEKTKQNKTSTVKDVEKLEFYCQQECKMVQPQWEIVWRFLKKLNQNYHMIHDSGDQTWHSVATQRVGMEWEVGERFKREGTYVYLWLIHIDVRQKSTQYCKAIILQLKILLKKRTIVQFSNLNTFKRIKVRISMKYLYSHVLWRTVYNSQNTETI